jgi:hypothetical protein
MDIINKATKFADHYRGTLAGLAVLATCVYAAGCSAWDGKVVSTSTGEVVDADERYAEYVADSQELKDRARLAQAKVDEGLRELENIQEDADAIDFQYDADTEAIKAEVQARSEGIGAIGQAVVAQVPGAAWVLPFLTVGAGGLAGGAVYDSRRKDRVIRDQKEPKSAS